MIWRGPRVAVGRSWVAAELFQIEMTGGSRPVVYAGRGSEDGLSVLGDRFNCFWELDRIFFCSSNKFLVSPYFMPSFVLGSENTTMNKTYTISLPMDFMY